MNQRGLRWIALLLGTTLMTSPSYIGNAKPDSYEVDGTSIYHTFGTFAEDPNFEKQWAFQNDGTFVLEEELNDFPVYTDPFEEPINDWNWWGSEKGHGPWDNSFFEGDYDWESFWESPLDELFRSIFGFSAGNTEKYPFGVTAKEGIDINMPEAWEAYQGSVREVIVAVIDTGIDINHEDLDDAIWMNEGEIPGDGIDNDGNGYIDDVYGWNFYNNNNQVFVGDEDSHGTHGAGTIAATLNDIGVAGIAGNTSVKVMVIKALGGEDGTGTSDSIIRAIQYAEENGADICNLSFGTTENNRKLRQTIEQSEMLFIASAGNGDDWTGTGQNSDRNPIYPAAYDLDNIISVANLNFNGTLHSSSNYGKTSVDLAAPGSYILSTTPGNTYSYMTGTSMAAPMVTGVAALLYSQYEDITLQEVKEILLASVQPLDGLEKVTATGGMLDAYAALTYDRTLLATKDRESEEQKVGSAPEFLLQIVNEWEGTYLIVTVTDADEDLAEICFEAGRKTNEYFKKGLAGTKIILGEDGTKRFKLNGSGLFTFYAIDAEGNETVETVFLRK